MEVAAQAPERIRGLAPILIEEVGEELRRLFEQGSPFFPKAERFPGLLPGGLTCPGLSGRVGSYLPGGHKEG